MPSTEWSTKRKRQYQHIKDSVLVRGESEPVTEEIAARTVDKVRAQQDESETSSASWINDMPIKSEWRASVAHRNGRALGGKTSQRRNAAPRQTPFVDEQNAAAECPDARTQPMIAWRQKAFYPMVSFGVTKQNFPMHNFRALQAGQRNKRNRSVSILQAMPGMTADALRYAQQFTTQRKLMTTKDHKVGDKVSWNSTQGTVTGTVRKKLTAPIDIKTHHVAASPDNPQLLVESAGSGKFAAHKPAALTRIKARGRAPKSVKSVTRT